MKKRVVVDTGKKAQYFARTCRLSLGCCILLADDSGFIVQSLNLGGYIG